MSEREQWCQYLLTDAQKHRINVWLRSQGFRPEPMDPHQKEDGATPTYRLVAIPIGDDADVGITEACRLLSIAASTVHRWVETDRIRHRQQTRIPINELRRIAEEGGRPPTI